VSSIQAKKQAFDELETSYHKVLQTKDPHWGSSALCDLALAAENLSENLSRLPDIEGRDRKKIQSQMASQVASWRAKAKSFVGSAAKTIDKFGTLHLDNRRIIQEAHRLKEDSLQFNDWLPSLLEAEPVSSRSSPWVRWNEVAATLLEESSRPQNGGMPTLPTMIQALDFAMLKRDFSRVEWLNERLLLSSEPRYQSLGHWNQGRLAARLDDFDRAEAAMKNALRLDPDNKDLQKQLGLFYARFGFFAKALPQLTAVAGDPQVDVSLVAVERQLELNEQADRLCESLTQEPQISAEGLYNCSLLEFQNHRNATRAITWMEEALQRARGPLAEQARSQLSLMQTWKARYQAMR
jgi:tetratricopeptide (TPR) repeat protein